MSMLLTENVGYVLKRCSVARYCALLMRVANTHCSCALPMHEYIFLILFVFPEADGSDESTCGLGPRPQKKSKQPQLQPKQTHEQRQVSNPKAFGLHRQRKKNCAARASMHVPVEASKRAYNLHSKQKRTKKHVQQWETGPSYT